MVLRRRDLRTDAQVGEAFTMLTMPPGRDIEPTTTGRSRSWIAPTGAAWLDHSISARTILKPLPAGSLAVEQVG